MGSNGRSLGAVFGAMACLLCIGLLVSVALQSAPMATAAAEGSFRNSKGISLGRPHAHLNLEHPFHATIKRRVPNGPDPIHNRRAGKSGRPPGRA